MLHGKPSVFRYLQRSSQEGSSLTELLQDFRSRFPERFRRRKRISSEQNGGRDIREATMLTSLWFWLTGRRQPSYRSTLRMRNFFRRECSRSWISVVPSASLHS